MPSQPPRILTIASIVTGLLAISVTVGASPVAEPTIPDLVAAAGSATDHDGADAVVVFDRTDVEVEDSGLSHIVQHRLVKILTHAGARDRSFQRFDYDPASQAIEVRKVRIWRAGRDPVDVDLAGLVDVTPRPTPSTGAPA